MGRETRLALRFTSLFMTTKLSDRVKQIDRGWLVVGALCVLAAWPFLSRPGLPAATDAELHVHRLAELARLVSAGEFYPRWAPNFYFGYGYPIFNYYAPLSYYLGLPLTLLPYLDAVTGVKFAFVISLAASGVGMYGFVRANWGRVAAWVATGTFLFAPYVHYVDPHARGDLAESVSFGVFAVALWALDSVRRGASSSHWLASVLLVAALVTSHNLMALVLFALLLAWSLWWLPEEPRASGVCLAALLLGVGTAAFFWVPVALEQGAVSLNTLIGDGGHFDFRNHFLGLRELVGPSAWLDWGATEARFTLNLGPAQWLLGLVGAVLIVKGHRRYRHALLFVIAAAALFFMMTPLALPVWETLPILPYFQFPWRLLGPAAATLAVLAGVGASELERLIPQAVRPWLAPALLAIVLALALPLLQVPPWPAAQWDTSTAGLVLQETQGRWLGTTSTGDFVPVTVDTIPRATEQLLQGLRAGEPLDRVNRHTLPAGTTVDVETLSPLHTRYHVNSAEPFLLRLYQFVFPGWEVRIDGAPVATEVGRPEGFLVAPLPSGSYAVDVAFVDTAARKLAWAVSGISLLAAVVLARTVMQNQARRSGQPQQARDGAAGRALFTVTLVLALHVVVVEPLGLLRYESSGREVATAEVLRYGDFGGQIALLGYDAPESAAPGDKVEVTLYWKAQRKLDVNFQVFVHLLAPDGTVVAQSDKLNPGDFPTKRWPLDRYVRDLHEVALPSEMPAGSYRLSVGLWVQNEGWRLPLFDDAEQQIGDNLVLQEIDIR